MSRPTRSEGTRYMRPVLRKASLIVPFTGERVHVSDFGRTARSFTLRTPVPTDGESSPTLAFHDTTPLLARSRATSIRAYHDPTWWESLWEMLATARNFLGSKNSRMILKCSIAYFLGSLATFVAPIAALLGKNDGKHMVATIAVYFHPARTVGSMFEAMIYAFTALFYSTFVSIASMATSCLFDDLDLIILGHAIVLIVFCAGGLGLIGWIKQRMASPTVGVACSLAAISIITIETKEGSVQRAQFSMTKITQVFLIVLMAIFVSTLVAFVLWPSSAIKELRACMDRSTDSFSDMLAMITRAFLSGSENELHSTAFSAAAAEHRTVFTALTKNLAEAKYEHYMRGTEKEYHIEKKLVACMQRLAQHIGGLQSAARSQFELLHEQEAAENGLTSPVSVENEGSREEAGVEAIFTPPMHNTSPHLSSHHPATPATVDSTLEPILEVPQQPAGIFEEFMYHVGPPMKSLVYTLKVMLDNLPSATDQGPDFRIEVNPRFRESLVSAIKLYSEARSQALNTLYQGLKAVPAASRSRGEEWAADVEEIAGCCGYFSFCLQDFAQEMITFLDILEEMEDCQHHTARSWTWLKFWRYFGLGKSEYDQGETLTGSRSVPDLLRLGQHTRKNVPNVARDQALPFTYRVWKALGVFRRDDVKFGIKVGGGAAIYALPAFIPATRPTFSYWRGEWGLVSYMIVMSMTIGQTNSSGYLRVLGTIIGAGLAVAAWIIAPENPYLLSVIGWLISLPCFHIILNWKQSTFGRFILLTYNLSCLYAYSLSAADDDDDDDEGGINPMITAIAFHRLVSVLVGVAWGIFINRYIWPISARRKLRRGLSVLWLRLALIWKRGPLNSLIDGESEKSYMNITEEHALQKALLRLSSLVSQAQSEFRLKGPFPITEYSHLISANQSIIDACHGMSVMMRKDPTPNERERDLLNYTAQERRDLCARIAHLFYVLASSIQLGFPLPESLPKVDRARDRLLARVWGYRERVRGAEGQSDEDFALLYAYVLVVGRVSHGIQECIESVGKLYGVLEDEMLEI